MDRQKLLGRILYMLTEPEISPPATKTQILEGRDLHM